MTDSLFSSRNVHDAQLAVHDATACEMLTDALARRMSTLKGPTETARRFQRIADVCAGAHVMPIDYWRAEAKPVVATEPQLGRASRVWVWVWIMEHPGLVFCAGFIAGGMLTR